MKKIRLFTILVLTACMLLVTTLPALAVPPLPKSLYGTVQFNGANVPDGTVITAWINGIQYASDTTTTDSGFSVYNLNVPGDDPDTVGLIEGGVSGEIISFHIGPDVALQTATWSSGSAQQNLPLTGWTTPGALTKTSPANGALNIPAAPTLTWAASTGATAYEYCYDNSNNGTCEGTWVSTGTNLSVTLAGLNTGRAYYWQVRAVNGPITTYADSGTMWAFTTVPTFADVPYTNWAWDWIERLYRAGVTNGCGWSPLIYCPAGSTTRAEMAKFLERGKHYPVLFNPPAGTGLVFTDVPASHWASGWIEQLFADGITTGCNLSPLIYCPEQKVTRAEMAAFLLRAKHGASYTPPPATGVFTDVPTSYWAAGYIEQLYAEGITTGCLQSPLQYCPLQEVTRAEMAAFLVRTFTLP